MPDYDDIYLTLRDEKIIIHCKQMKVKLEAKQCQTLVLLYLISRVVLVIPERLDVQEAL